MGSASSVKQKQPQQHHQATLEPSKIIASQHNNNKCSNQHKIKKGSISVFKIPNEELPKQEQIHTNHLVSDGYYHNDVADCHSESEYQSPSFAQFQGEHFCSHSENSPPNLETNKYRLFGDYYTPDTLGEQQNALGAKTPQGKYHNQTQISSYYSMSKQKGQFSFIDHFSSNKKHTRSLKNQGSLRDPIEKEEQALTGHVRQQSSSSEYSQQYHQYFSQIQGKTHANNKDDILYSRGNVVLKLQGEDAVKQNVKSSQQQSNLLKYLLVDLKVQPTEYILTQDTANSTASSNGATTNSSVIGKNINSKDSRLTEFTNNKNKNNSIKNAQVSITTYPGYLEVINSPNELR